MSVNVAVNIECWSLMEFGCDLADTFQPRLFYSLTLCCCFDPRTVYTLHYMYVYFESINDHQLCFMTDALRPTETL